MDKRLSGLIVLAGLSILVTASLGAWSGIYHMPMTAHIPEPTLTMYIDGESWTNETTVDFGEIAPYQTYTKNFTVANMKVTNVTVYISTQGLEPTWSLTWTKNNTLIQPSMTTSGNLTLSVGEGTSGTYSWNMTVHVTET